MNYRKSEAKQAAREQFHGLWAALTTPFTPDLELDEDGLRQNMRYLTGKIGVKGVFCTGTMGEFWALTNSERKRIVEIVVEEARRGGCKVIAHTPHHSAHETVELTRHAQEVGADFVILMNPYYPPMSEELVYQWFEFVAARVDIGIWMFDARYSGYNLSPELTARIAGIENVCGIKCPRPPEHIARVKELVGDKLVISSPSEANLLMHIREFGMQVYQSSQTPYLFQTPSWRPLREYSDYAWAGKFSEAAEAHKALAPLRPLHQKWYYDQWTNHKVVPVAYVKAWSEFMGMAGGPVRPGLPQITDTERAELRIDLERTGILDRVERKVA